MKKTVIPAIIILLLQIVVAWLCQTIILGHAISAGIGFGGFTGQAQLWPIGLISFITLPIVFGKWLLRILNVSITWRRCITTYFCIFGTAMLLSVFWFVVFSNRF